jgi:hypothetical protein
MARYALLLARPVEMRRPVLDNVQVNPIHGVFDRR